METQAGDSQSRFGASVWAPAALSSLDRQTSLRATASAALANCASEVPSLPTARLWGPG